ncbi:UTP--glucose-1-phosphate uridylyltransferase [Dermatophagoides pteronyssinus]|uniref:UTP--glucose-1-phosphate uridylyltransferase n=1 Tax=Dermatophagoides pteronyssinus TaxID=6956 RepID=A0ABQ8JGX9_DERPT|nr:UTP--glucose-1-phosphate uridylyltransferase [Dermatophagoides pteronyssinus]
MNFLAKNYMSLNAKPTMNLDMNINRSNRHQRKISSTTEFKEIAKKDSINQLSTELDKLSLTCKNEEEKKHFLSEARGFKDLFEKFIVGNEAIVWDKIQPLPDEAVCRYGTLDDPPPEIIREMLNQLVVVKLNGGLGTSMGCTGPKSVIPVRNDLTFLDLTVQQIEKLNKTYDADVPLVLMNSFNTHDDTQKLLRKYAGFRVAIFTFMQSRYPRINKETLMPISTSLNSNPEDWYPPGHGDFYQSFFESNLLDDFLKAGRKYVFLSNIDNLGATVDLKILNYLLNPSISSPPTYVMEVTDKTHADVKGGTLIQYEGHIRLLEIAQVPKAHVEEFKSVKKFKIFNTNNLWINLNELKRLVESKMLNMDIIVNNKHLDCGIDVIQLETAVGSAMKTFSGAIGVNVPRSRFLPVKKTSDLLLVMSNLYSLNDGALIMNPLRSFPSVPLVKLGDSHFTKVRDFISRFASIPDMVELIHLTVSGDVTFGSKVVLKGTVIIIANHGERIDIPSGAILENKIVSGNLRILDH